MPGPHDKPEILTLRILKRWVREQCLGVVVELYADLSTAFVEEQIFRIDHYLAKETVQNLLALRFANSIFEPIWNRTWVDNVQITVAETLGVGDRGGAFGRRRKARA